MGTCLTNLEMDVLRLFIWVWGGGGSSAVWIICVLVKLIGSL